MTLLLHELKMNMKSFLIWSLTISIMGFSFMLMFPMLKDSLKDMNDQFANLGGLSAAFGMDQLSLYSPMGYYGTQVGIILLLGGALYGALLGTGMLSKEESGHTSEYLFSAPISRSSVVLQKGLAMLMNLLAFEILYIVSILISFAIIQEPIETKGFILYHVAQFCLHFEIACVCFAISAFMKKSSLGIGMGIALTLYFVDIMEKTISKLDFLKYFTPFTYAGAGDVIGKSQLDMELLGIGLVVTVISCGLAYWQYVRKDLAA